MVDTGAVQLAIHRPESEDPQDGDYLPEARTVIWFQPAEGVPAAAETLANAGVELVRPKNASNYLYFRDPQGNVLGLHQPVE